MNITFSLSFLPPLVRKLPSQNHLHFTSTTKVWSGSFSFTLAVLDKSPYHAVILKPNTQIIWKDFVATAPKRRSRTMHLLDLFVCYTSAPDRERRAFLFAGFCPCCTPRATDFPICLISKWQWAGQGLSHVTLGRTFINQSQKILLKLLKLEDHWSRVWEALEGPGYSSQWRIFFC